MSADFRRHTRALFTEAVLAHHDRSAFEVVCYSDVTVPDDTTARFRGLADAWRDTGGLPDAALARLVGRDKIDVLVELTGHMSGNRLLVFARRPAPVQVAYPGYPGTTGLRTLDALITDADRDPPGDADRFHTEPLVRLPDTALCYRPPGDAPPVGPLPAPANGFVTFGATNRLAKVTPEMAGLWAEVLARLPGARLLALAVDPAAAARYLARCGLDPARLDVRGRLPRAAYMALYREVDVCLDTYPYNGNTTTCDALWMGVPTVSLYGRTRAARHGLHLARLAGLPGLAADAPAGYVDVALHWASDLPRQAEVRAGLRDHVRRCPLGDGPGQARQVEQVYRDAWRAWCARQVNGR